MLRTQHPVKILAGGNNFEIKDFQNRIKSQNRYLQAPEKKTITFMPRVVGKEQARGPIKASYGLPEEQWQVGLSIPYYLIPHTLVCRFVTSTGRPRKSKGKAILLLATQLSSSQGEEHSKEAPQEGQGSPPEPFKEAAQVEVLERGRGEQRSGS